MVVAGTESTGGALPACGCISSTIQLPDARRTARPAPHLQPARAHPSAEVSDLPKTPPVRRTDDWSAELELVVNRNYILIAARHRRLGFDFFLFFHEVEVRFFRLFLSLLFDRDLHGRATALACTRAGLDEPGQRG